MKTQEKLIDESMKQEHALTNLFISILLNPTTSLLYRGSSERIPGFISPIYNNSQFIAREFFQDGSNISCNLEASDFGYRIYYRSEKTDDIFEATSQIEKDKFEAMAIMHQQTSALLRTPLGYAIGDYLKNLKEKNTFDLVEICK